MPVVCAFLLLNCKNSDSYKWRSHKKREQLCKPFPIFYPQQSLICSCSETMSVMMWSNTALTSLPSAAASSSHLVSYSFFAAFAASGQHSANFSKTFPPAPCSVLGSSRPTSSSLAPAAFLPRLPRPAGSPGSCTRSARPIRSRTIPCLCCPSPRPSRLQ